MTTWVIGHGGLLGSALTRHLRTSSPTHVHQIAAAIPWSDPQQAANTLVEEYLRFREAASTDDWRIIWAAGAATVATDRNSAMAELQPLQALVEAIRDQPPKGRGAFFLTSSAGGVFAGSVNPPFNAASLPAPLSAYGELKLAQEELVAQVLASICPVVIGRFSNLYGPGQNLTKLQGLISRLALAGINQQPLSIFVPLDTIRDYIYVDDAAAAAIHLTNQAATTQDLGARIAIIASGQPVTIGQVIHTMAQVARRKIPVAYGSHHSSGAQALDLRLVPSPGINVSTPLPAGMKMAYMDILERTQASRS